MNEIIEFWIKVSLCGVVMALVFGAIAAAFSWFKDRRKS